jgi:hypothetical protein
MSTTHTPTQTHTHTHTQKTSHKCPAQFSRGEKSTKRTLPETANRKLQERGGQGGEKDKKRKKKKEEEKKEEEERKRTEEKGGEEERRQKEVAVRIASALAYAPCGVFEGPPLEPLLCEFTYSFPLHGALCYPRTHFTVEKTGSERQKSPESQSVKQQM